MKDLTQGNLKKHLYDLALPTIGGMIAFSLFNVTDTYFVGKLGTNSLAAMGFTFPVVMIAAALSSGISTGAMSLLAKAYGDNNKDKMKRIATDGMLLSLILVSILSLIGLSTMDTLFGYMGANETILPMVKSYMTVWYSCIIVVMMPPVSDASMRALGDTIRPFRIMLICAVFNIILDPIFIFGWFVYLVIVIIGSVGLNLYNYNAQVLNGLGLSIKALIINGLGTFGVIIPLMYLGSQYSFVYMLLGLVIGQLILGLISTKIGRDIVQKLALEDTAKTAVSS